MKCRSEICMTYVQGIWETSLKERGFMLIGNRKLRLGDRMEPDYEMSSASCRELKLGNGSHQKSL